MASQAFEQYLSGQRDYERILAAVDDLPKEPSIRSANFLLVLVGVMGSEKGSRVSVFDIMRTATDCVRAGIVTDTGLEYEGRPQVFGKERFTTLISDLRLRELADVAEGGWALTDAGQAIFEAVKLPSHQDTLD